MIKSPTTKRNLSIFKFERVLGSLMFTIPVWVAYERQFISISELTLIEAAILGSQFLFELPTGAFADLVGKKITVATGYFISFISMIVFALARDFPTFLIFGLLSGLGDALRSGATEALLYDSLKEGGRENSYDKYYAKYGIHVQMALAAATLIGGFLGNSNVFIPIGLHALTLLFAGLTSLGFIEPHIDTEKFTLKNYVSQTRQGFNEIRKNSYILKLSLFYILVGGLTWSCQLLFNVVLLTDLKFPAWEFGLYLSLIRLINSVLVFKVVHLKSVINKSKSFILFPVILISAFLPGVFYTKWSGLIAIAFIMFSSTARWTILGAYTNSEFSSKNRATAISTLSMAIGLIYVVIVTLSGPIMAWYGDARIIYSVFGILSILFILPLGLNLAKITQINNPKSG